MTKRGVMIKKGMIMKNLRIQNQKANHKRIKRMRKKKKLFMKNILGMTLKKSPTKWSMTNGTNNILHMKKKFLTAFLKLKLGQVSFPLILRAKVHLKCPIIL